MSVGVFRVALPAVACWSEHIGEAAIPLACAAVLAANLTYCGVLLRCSVGTLTFD
jgi:hypothetical protein